MLLKFRGGLNSLPVMILLGLLIAAFAIFGIGPGILSGPSNVIASVGETDVPFATYVRNVQQEAQQTQIQFGANVSQDELIRLLNLDQRVLQQMIVDASIEEHTRELGLRATDEQVIDGIREIDAFRLAGALNISSIQVALQNNNLGADDLEDLIGKGVTREQLLSAMIDVKPIPKSLANELFTWQDERRQATLITLKASEITDVADPTEEELLAAYDASKESYMSNEIRSYNYLVVTPDLFMSKVEISEEELLDAFAIREDEYITPERRTILQANFPTATAANAFVDAVNAGATFTEKAVELTDFSATELELGTFTKRELTEEIDDVSADAAFAVELNGISAPVARLGSWNVFSATSIQAGTNQTFDDVKVLIEADLMQEKATDLMYDFLPDLEDVIASEATLADVIASPSLEGRVDLTVATVSGTDRQGRDRAGNQVITQSDEFRIMSELFREETEIGQLSDPFDLDLSNRDRVTFFTELVAITEPEQKEYSEVASTVRAAWINQQKQNKAGEIADQALERLKAGEDAEEIAAELGGTSLAANNVSRSNDPASASGLAANIRSLIFELPINNPAVERSADGDGYVIVRTDAVRPGEPARRIDQVDQLYTQLQQQFEGELLQQYQTYLSKRYKPEVRDHLRELQFRTDAATQ
jgi:hypothetical protein